MPRQPKLKYIDTDKPGYSRRKWGRGFRYLDREGKSLEGDTLEWAKSLVIPPMWEEVWISPDPNGHILSTGRDDKGRKQYLYHPDWAAQRQQLKFDKLVGFAEALPTLRRRLAEDLSLSGWSRDKVTAVAVSLLDEAGLRIGNRQYYKSNQTTGLTTLRRKHISLLDDGSLKLNYKGKSNQYRDVMIDNPELVKLIKACSELPGYELFRYCDENGENCTLDSSDVNEYLQRHIGDGFSSKDFRTWHGTTTAVKVAPECHRRVAAGEAKQPDVEVVKCVAEKLGNTVSVCRKYYIHPTVLEAVTQPDLPDVSAVSKALRRRFRGALDDSELLTYYIIGD